MRDDECTMSVHRAVASKCDDASARLLQELAGMSSVESKAFSSKGEGSPVTRLILERNPHARRSLAHEQR